MQWRYGTFEGLPVDNWAYAGGQRVAVRKNGELTAVLATINFKFLIHATTADRTAAQLQLGYRMQEIKNGVKFDGYNVGFLHDDGSPSQFYLDSSQSQSGVRITKYPFAEVDTPGADYSTGLAGSCSFEAEYAPEQLNGGGGGNQSKLVDYAESVSVQGNGGPRKVLQEYESGDPEWFTLADKTPVRATQQGQAVLEGYSDVFPFTNPPLWPDLLDNESEGLTKNIARIAGDRWQCNVQWVYNFTSPGPLTGQPSVRNS